MKINLNGTSRLSLHLMQTHSLRDTSQRKYSQRNIGSRSHTKQLEPSQENGQIFKRSIEEEK